MKRMKKIFSALLAFMMLATMSVPAMAAAEPVTELNFTKTMVVDKGAVVPETRFTFTMKPDSTVREGAKTEEGLSIYPGQNLGDKGTVEISFANSDVTSYDEDLGKDEITKSAVFDLSGLKFDKVGVYRYTVEETNGNTNNVEYDKTKYTVDIFVDTDLDIMAVVATVAGQSEKTPIKFTNSFASDSLKVSKNVVGNFGEKDRDFEFSVLIESNDTLKDGTKINAYIIKNDSTKEDITITVGSSFDFKLKHGESLQIDELHIGTEYTVTEKNYADYSCTITSTENSVEQSKIKNSTVSNKLVSGGNLEKFENSREKVVDTGIMLNIAPFAVVFLFAISGIVLMIVKRRKTSR